MTNTRRITLRGAHNLRDLGGYQTREGKVTKWRMLYRSDQLSKLTTGDRIKFDNLGIRLIIDLRGAMEIRSDRHVIPAGNNTAVKNLPLFDTRIDYDELKKNLFKGKLSQIDFREFLLDNYHNYVTAHNATIKTLFEQLQNPANYPVLFHCNGGKDRSGIVAALILFALNVPIQTIIEDYMLSEIYMEKRIWQTLIKIKLLSIFRANTKQFRPILETRLEYLESALRIIDSTYGSVDSYLDELGVNNQARLHLGSILCD